VPIGDAKGVVLGSNVVLAVGAHPDDIELGCGGTIRAAVVAGKKVVAVFLTRGEKSGDPSQRSLESKRALAVLGVTDVYFGEFPDTEIPNSSKVIDFLEDFHNKTKPETVLTHTIHDLHQDHRQVAWHSLSAFRNASRLLAYESPRVTGAFNPAYFVDISGHVTHKFEALKCHLTQNQKRYLAYESMVNLSSFRGSQVGLGAAEAFEVVRYVETALH
jgi:LmbE family N-acetylglucosaminyl deacetylase